MRKNEQRSRRERDKERERERDVLDQYRSDRAADHRAPRLCSFDNERLAQCVLRILGPPWLSTLMKIVISPIKRRNEKKGKNDRYRTRLDERLKRRRMIFETQKFLAKGGIPSSWSLENFPSRDSCTGEYAGFLVVSANRPRVFAK